MDVNIHIYENDEISSKVRYVDPDKEGNNPYNLRKYFCINLTIRKHGCGTDEVTLFIDDVRQLEDFAKKIIEQATMLRLAETERDQREAGTEEEKGER